jgi:hypothetical protein
VWVPIEQSWYAFATPSIVIIVLQRLNVPLLIRILVKLLPAQVMSSLQPVKLENTTTARGVVVVATIPLGQKVQI